MAIDIITWILGAAFAAVTIFLTYILYAYVMPIRSTPLMNLLNAKKKGKPAVILDRGPYYDFEEVVDQGESYVKTKKGNFIDTPSGTIKFCRGGMKIIIACGFKGLAANTAIWHLIKEFTSREITVDDVNLVLLLRKYQITVDEIKDAKKKMSDAEYYTKVLKELYPEKYNELITEVKEDKEEVDANVAKQKA
jgi:hypothetical protein